MRRYTVVLTAEPDGSAWNVVVPTLPGCFTWGATVEEALAMARDAIATHLDGEPVAEFSPPGETVVAEVLAPVSETDGVLHAGYVAAMVGRGA
jgi:predicted RNase H-like HicB family nuclease